MTTSGAGGNRGQSPASELPLIAIIDDDASVRTSTRRLIRTLGYRAEAFTSGQEFLTSPWASSTACLLLDLRMPEMDGFEVQRRVAATYPSIPIIFISGHASDDDKGRARSAGAIEFLRKPIATSILVKILNDLFARRDGKHGQDG